MFPISRRTLLKNGPLAAASMTLLTTMPEMIRAASLAKATGIQLYTVGKELQEDMAGTLAKVAALGTGQWRAPDWRANRLRSFANRSMTPA